MVLILSHDAKHRESKDAGLFCRFFGILRVKTNLRRSRSTFAENPEIMPPVTL
jgi:hypothetical protein